jgi:hypothetical protein
MSFLKNESGGLLKKHWNLVLEKFAHKPLDTCSCRWVRIFLSIEQNFGGEVTKYLCGCYP